LFAGADQDMIIAPLLPTAVVAVGIPGIVVADLITTEIDVLATDVPTALTAFTV
jgi:hypothetical protein